MKQVNDVERSIIQMESIAPKTMEDFLSTSKKWEERRKTAMRMLLEGRKKVGVNKN